MGNRLYAWVNGEVVGVFTNLGEGRISLEYAPGVVKPLSVVSMVEETVHKIRQSVKGVFDFYELPGVFSESVLESSTRIT